MKTLTRLHELAKSFLRQPRFIKVWFFPLWWLLGFSKLIIFIIPFRRLAKYLGRDYSVFPWVPLLNHAQETRALQIGRVVRLAARYTPWVSNCFPQAVAAHVLLSLYRIPYALYFGLMRDPETRELKAHAWVASGRVTVTGGENFGHYTVVGCFVSSILTEADKKLDKSFFL